MARRFLPAPEDFAVAVAVVVTVCVTAPPAPAAAPYDNEDMVATGAVRFTADPLSSVQSPSQRQNGVSLIHAAFCGAQQLPKSLKLPQGTLAESTSPLGQ
ncbi:MAG: hypothetical protein M1827_004918 [Pycnora praestabilis]|nr:MAG: hypothetical protein M1827_004918 [Pycnora praestabilis]